MWHIPEPQSLGSRIGQLVDDGWIDSRRKVHRRRYRDQVGEKLESLAFDEVIPDVKECLEIGAAQSIGFSPTDYSETSRDNSDRLFWEMPKGTPLSLRWCWGMAIYVSNALRIIPPGEMPCVLRCPRCGENLMPQLDAVLSGIETPAVEVPLKQCTHCGGTVELGEVVRLADAAVAGCPPIEETAPFYRFALELHSDSPPEDPAVTDPTLMQSLVDCTRQKFRVFGRWG